MRYSNLLTQPFGFQTQYQSHKLAAPAGQNAHKPDHSNLIALLTTRPTSSRPPGQLKSPKLSQSTKSSDILLTRSKQHPEEDTSCRPPNAELIKQIVAQDRLEAAQGEGPKRSHYHEIKDIGEVEIRSLSKVIENSIVTAMVKNKSIKRIGSQKDLVDKEKQAEESRREKEYLA